MWNYLLPFPWSLLPHPTEHSSHSTEKPCYAFLWPWSFPGHHGRIYSTTFPLLITSFLKSFAALLPHLLFTLQNPSGCHLALFLLALIAHDAQVFFRFPSFHQFIQGYFHIELIPGLQSMYSFEMVYTNKSGGQAERPWDHGLPGGCFSAVFKLSRQMKTCCFYRKKTFVSHQLYF